MIDRHSQQGNPEGSGYYEIWEVMKSTLREFAVDRLGEEQWKALASSAMNDSLVELDAAGLYKLLLAATSAALEMDALAVVQASGQCLITHTQSYAFLLQSAAHHFPDLLAYLDNMFQHMLFELPTRLEVGEDDVMRLYCYGADPLPYQWLGGVVEGSSKLIYKIEGCRTSVEPMSESCTKPPHHVMLISGEGIPACLAAYRKAQHERERDWQAGQYSMPASMFSRVYPYHFIIDKQCQLVQAGPAFRKLDPRMVPGAKAINHLAFSNSRTHYWDYDHLLAWGSNQTLVLSAGSLEMKGHFVQTTMPMPQAVDASLLGGPPGRAEEQEVLLFLMVPKIKCVDDLRSAGLRFCDLQTTGLAADYLVVSDEVEELVEAQRELLEEGRTKEDNNMSVREALSEALDAIDSGYLLNIQQKPGSATMRAALLLDRILMSGSIPTREVLEMRAELLIASDRVMAGERLNDQSVNSISAFAGGDSEVNESLMTLLLGGRRASSSSTKDEQERNPYPGNYFNELAGIAEGDVEDASLQKGTTTTDGDTSGHAFASNSTLSSASASQTFYGGSYSNNQQPMPLARRAGGSMADARSKRIDPSGSQASASEEGMQIIQGFSHRRSSVETLQLGSLPESGWQSPSNLNPEMVLAAEYSMAEMAEQSSPATPSKGDMRSKKPKKKKGIISKFKAAVNKLVTEPGKEKLKGRNSFSGIPMGALQLMFLSHHNSPQSSKGKSSPPRSSSNHGDAASALLSGLKLSPPDQGGDSLHRAPFDYVEGKPASGTSVYSAGGSSTIILRGSKASDSVPELQNSVMSQNRMKQLRELGGGQVSSTSNWMVPGISSTSNVSCSPGGAGGYSTKPVRPVRNPRRRTKSLLLPEDWQSPKAESFLQDSSLGKVAPSQGAGSSELFIKSPSRLAIEQSGLDPYCSPTSLGPNSSGLNAGMLSMVKSPPDEVTQALSQIDEWKFDTFALERAANGRPLSMLGFSLLQRVHKRSSFELNETKLVKFLLCVEDGYPPNPYHCRTHAADVLQKLHVISTRSSILRCASATSDTEGSMRNGARERENLSLLAAYIAAIIHDFEHRGVNNHFLIHSEDSLATLYNDVSPMENHHVAAAFKLLRQDEYNFLENLPRKKKDALRAMVIELVLATDMKQGLVVAMGGCYGEGGQAAEEEGRTTSCGHRTRAGYRHEAGERVRSQIIDLVLATDMQLHFSTVAAFNAKKPLFTAAVPSPSNSDTRSRQTSDQGISVVPNSVPCSPVFKASGNESGIPNFKVSSLDLCHGSRNNGIKMELEAIATVAKTVVGTSSTNKGRSTPARLSGHSSTYLGGSRIATSDGSSSGTDNREGSARGGSLLGMASRNSQGAMDVSTDRPRGTWIQSFSVRRMSPSTFDDAGSKDPSIRSDTTGSSGVVQDGFDRENTRSQRSRKALLEQQSEEGNSSHQVSPLVVAPQPCRPPDMDEETRMLVWKVALKCADLGHLASPKILHLKWVHLLEEEMFRQGDRERQAKNSISPLMDRCKTGITKSQPGFFNVVVLPLFTDFVSAFPMVAPLLNAVQENFDMWQAEAAAAEPHPNKSGGPPQLMMKSMQPRSRGGSLDLRPPEKNAPIAPGQFIKGLNAPNLAAKSMDVHSLGTSAP
eukprot:gene3974-14053_t